MEGTIVATEKKVKHCDMCGTDVEAEIVDRQSVYNFRGERFEINEQVLICECGQELYDETLDSETMKKLTKMYEKHIGLNLDEIKSIRAKYGLSMELFSRILGWSKASIARYESGKYIPDSSHLSILKRLKEKPESIDEYYKLNKHKLSVKEQEKISGILSDTDQTAVEKSLIGALNLNYKLYEQTIETGYSNFNLNKLINMILYFTSKGVSKTKLMKLLFYSDFLNFKRNLISLSGTPYVRLPYGPVPKDHDLLLSTIEKNEIIDIEYEYVNEYTFINIKAKEQFDPSQFSDDELEILEQVEQQFKEYGSVAISNFSHEEDGWNNTEYREIISYDYAETLKID